MAKPEWFNKLPLAPIEYATKRYGLDFNLVCAIIQHESGGVPFKTRYEAHTDKYVMHPRDYASKLGISAETETVAQKHSYGLMQLMGYCARELSFDDYLVKLCNPEIGLEFSCRKLKKIFQWSLVREESDAIAAWNWGNPAKDKTGMYKAQHYLNKVNALLYELRKPD